MADLKLRPYQREAIDAVTDALRDEGIRRPAIGLPTGCHAKGTPIMMYSGATRKVEDVVVGDLLMGPDSTPRCVLHLARGRQAMRRIVPVKGEPWVVNQDHVLVLAQSGAGSLPTPDGHIVEITVRDWEQWPEWKKNRFKLFRVPVEYPSRPEPVLDPWFVGAMLGDGSLSKVAGVAITKPDRELVAALTPIAASHGLRIRSEGGTHHLVGRRPGRGHHSNPILNALRDLGLMEITGRERFVPDDYLYGSKDTRLNVLAGLIDTDANLTDNCWDFTSVSETLSRNVATLARSLGLAAYVRPRRQATNFAPNGVDSWRVSISGECSIVPVVISRKAAHPRQRVRSVLRTGLQVDALPEDDYYGFSLDGDRRYLLADFTVVRNTGKTIVFSHLIKERGHPALILAHRDELIEQAADKISQVDGSTFIGRVKAGLNDVNHPIVVASVQTLSRQSRLSQMPKDIRTVVIDEAHHAAADSYRRVIDYFSETELILGVSATLERHDKRQLGDVWEKVVFTRTILEMIEAGYLSDIRAHAVSLVGVDFTKLKVSHGDFIDSEVAEMLMEAHAPEVAVRAYNEHAAGRKTIIFTPTVAVAHAMADEFTRSGIKAAAVDGQMDIEERRDILHRFSQGEIRVVANCQVLTEGYDEPSVDCVMIARPTRSRVMYTQMIGRGTRLYPGKTDLLVLDLGGNTDRLDIMSIPRLFNISGKDAENGVAVTREQQRERDQQARRQAGLFDAGLEIESHEADLFSRKDLNWLRLSDGRWILSAGEIGTLALEPFDGKWQTVVRSKERSVPPMALSTQPHDLGYAMGIAEEYLRKESPKSSILVAKGAPWRLHHASDKQKSTLRSMGIPFDEGAITKGEAADFLSAAFASRR